MLRILRPYAKMLWVPCASLCAVIGLTSCGLLGQIADADLPTQYVIASIDRNPQNQSALVRIFRSAASNRQTWSTSSLTDTIDTEHGDPNAGGQAIWARGGSSPGIGTDGAYYVMAFWGRFSTTAFDDPIVSMFVSVSHNGVAWTIPVPAHSTNEVFSNQYGVVPQSAISVASAGRGGYWFAAYGDQDGEITIVPLPVTGPGYIDRLIDTTATVTTFTSERPPALSFLENELVLAFWNGSTIQIASTADGRSWTTPPHTAVLAAAAGGGALPSAGGPPYLHRSGDAVMLTSTNFDRGATTGYIQIHESTDGVTFEPVTTIGIGQAIMSGVASAGPAPNEYVVTYPRRLYPDETRLFTPDYAERTITTNTNTRAAIAGGP